MNRQAVAQVRFGSTAVVHIHIGLVLEFLLAFSDEPIPADL